MMQNQKYFILMLGSSDLAVIHLSCDFSKKNILSWQPGMYSICKTVDVFRKFAHVRP